MTTTTEPIRVFIAPINNPTRGRWLDVGLDVRTELQEEIERVRNETGAEEVTLADAEGVPDSIMPQYGGVPVEEIAGLSALAEIHGMNAAGAYVRAYGAEVDAAEWEVDFQDRYRGTYDSKEEYAHEVAEMCHTGDLPVHYVDTTAILRDIEASGEATFVDINAHTVAVFANY